MGQRANRLPEMRQRTRNPDEKGGHALLMQGQPKVPFREDGTPLADKVLPSGSGKNRVYFPERRERHISSN